LIVSQVGTLIGFLILANAGTLWLVFLSRIIDGLTAGNLSLAQAYISDVTKPEERTKAFGLIGISFGLGFLVGPAISGFLSQFGYAYPVYAAAALSAMSIAATTFLLPGGKPPHHVEGAQDSRRLSIIAWGSYVQYFRQPELRQRLWQFLSFIFAFTMFMSGFALFAERRFTWDGVAFGPKQVGYVYAYVGVLAIIIQAGILGKLVKRLGESKLVSIGFATAAVGYGGLAFTYNVPLLLVMAAVSSFGSGVLRPALTSLITQKAGRSEQGSVLGLTQSMMSICQIVAPFIGGILIDHGLLGGWGLLIAFATVIGLFL
jgi:MFS family permease